MKKYDTYKDSGIEWLGEIPEHWNQIKLKHVTSCNSETLTDNTAKDLAINYVEIGDVSLEKGIESYESLLFSNAPSRAKRIVRKDDVIISTVRTYLKAITQIDRKYDGFIVSTGFAVLKPKQINSKYLGYVVSSENFIDEVISQSVGVSYPAINSSVLINIDIPIPLDLEQIFIASFLDHKTTQIDTLIEKKEQLVEKLTLKRQAIINEAVTKGLNHNVPMKDSGIEWLGEIPEHWEVVSLKYLVNHSTTKGDGKSELKVALENIESQTGIYLESEKKEFEGELKEFKKDDILFNKLRPYLAKVFKAPEDGECVSELLVFTCLSPVLIPDFLFWKLISQQIISVVDSSTYGAKMPRVGTDFMLNLPIALPLKDEQEGIIKHIADKIKIIDATSEKAKESIEKLKLYRQSLISEAVTGKIDLRDWKQTDNK